MHFSIAIIAPLMAALASASPLPHNGTAPGSVSIVGPTELPPNCYFPQGPEAREIICAYTSDEPGAYPEVVSTEPNSCKEDPEDGADVVCYLPGSPDFGKRSDLTTRDSQDAYLFRLTCDHRGCRTTQDASKRSADAAALRPIREAYDFHIRIKWKRDLADLVMKRAAAVAKQAYGFSIRIRF